MGEVYISMPRHNGEYAARVAYEALCKSLLRSPSNVTPDMPGIKNVIFNPPATIVFWSDGTKTVVKADKEAFDPEKGLAMAISKRALGNKGNYFNVFKKHITDDVRLEAAGANIAANIANGFKRAKESIDRIADRMMKEAEVASLRVKLDMAYGRLFEVYTKHGATKADLISAIESTLNDIGEVRK